MKSANAPLVRVAAGQRVKEHVHFETAASEAEAVCPAKQQLYTRGIHKGTSMALFITLLLSTLKNRKQA